MSKKTFRERLNEIIVETTEKTKDKKMKRTFSRKMFNDVVNAMVNDADYEQKTIQVKAGEPVSVKTTPIKDFREKLLTPILNDFKIDSEDAKKYISEYQFTKAQTECFYDLSCASMYEYMKTGKTFRFPSKEDFVASISIRRNKKSTYTNPKTGAKTDRGEFDSLVKKSTCPDWKRVKR